MNTGKGSVKRERGGVESEKIKTKIEDNEQKAE